MKKRNWPVGTVVEATEAYRKAFRGPYIGVVSGKARKTGYVQVRKAGRKYAVVYPERFWKAAHSV